MEQSSNGTNAAIAGIANRLEGIIAEQRTATEELRQEVEAVATAPREVRQLTKIEADAIAPRVHELRLLNARINEVLADLTRMSTLMDPRCADPSEGVHLDVSLDEGGVHVLRMRQPAPAEAP